MSFEKKESKWLNFRDHNPITGYVQSDVRYIQTDTTGKFRFFKSYDETKTGKDAWTRSPTPIHGASEKFLLNIQHNGQEKYLEVGKQILNQLVDMVKYKVDLKTTAVVITKSGSGLETKYAVELGDTPKEAEAQPTPTEDDISY